MFDSSEIGIVLIGMPGLEKPLARYVQFYSRIGFVHEFRPLGTVEIRRLLAQQWTPAGVNLPDQPLAEEVIAAMARAWSSSRFSDFGSRSDSPIRAFLRPSSGKGPISVAN
jgi:hypothetical protein